jgi:hypothetical protein
MKTPKFDFINWLKEEMTSSTSVGGGGSFTDSIARFSRPLFSKPVKRGSWDDNEDEKHRKKKKKN